MTMWLPLVAAKRISCLSSPPKQTPPRILSKNTISQEAVKIAPEPLSCCLMQANHRYFLCIKASRDTHVYKPKIPSVYTIPKVHIYPKIYLDEK